MPAASSRLLVACLATLAACGGDLSLPSDADPGGGSSPPPAGGPAPSVSASDDRFTTVEGQQRTLSVPAPGVLENDQSQGDASATLQAAVTEGPTHGTLDLRPDGSLDYTPEDHFFGQDRFTYKASVGQAASAEAAVVIDVLGMNDSPEFTPGPDQDVDTGKNGEGNEDRHGSPEVEVQSWATAIMPGPPNEADQSLEFQVTVVSGERSLNGVPTISPDGTLRFRPTKEPGTARVEVRLRDDGGTDNGGSDTSQPHFLNITVRASD